MERDMAEVKRKQKERLQSAAKRRSTATCSSRDRDMEGIALESVLQRFLNAPGSRRRARTPSPTSANLAENLLPKNQPNNESTKEGLSLTISLSYFDKENLDDQNPEQKSLRWRTSGEPASLPSKDEDLPTEQEVQKLREVSQRVLRFQSSRGSVSSGECISPVTSPRRRVFQEDEEKTMFVTNGEDVTQPLKSPLLLLPTSPTGISRRHTIAFPTANLSRTDADEDRFVPGEPENVTLGNHAQGVGNIGRIKSMDSYMPLPTDITPSKSEIMCKAEIRQETAESLSSSQQNPSVNGPSNHPKRTSRLMSFFKRLSEISKTNNRDPESSSVDP